MEFLLFGLEPQSRIAVQIWEPPATRMQTKIKFQLIFVPADGIRLPFFLERRPRNVPVFWAALSQANQLDRAPTYNRSRE
jgi:hypothetical protein